MIRLEKFTSDDFPAFKTWAKNEEELVQFAGTRFKFPLDDEQLTKYLNDRSVNAYKVIDVASGESIGHGEIFMAEDNIPKLCRIIIGRKDFRGQGIGEQIINCLLKICFYEFKAMRAELNVYDWNESAIRCYEKTGFVKNPAKRKNILVNGQTWTSINMVITRKAFEGNHRQ